MMGHGMCADIQLMLAAQCHLGTKNLDFQMERYVFKRRQDGIHIINLAKTWEKLQLAARIIVAIENPQACTQRVAQEELDENFEAGGRKEGILASLGQAPRTIFPRPKDIVFSLSSGTSFV